MNLGSIDLNLLVTLDALLTDATSGWEKALLAEALQRAGVSAAPTHDMREILFDPQTAGGLLIGLCADSAEAFVRTLRACDYAKERNVFGDKPIGSYQAIQHPLAEIKADAALAGIPLVKQSRLSVMPIEKRAFDRILKKGGTKL